MGVEHKPRNLRAPLKLRAKFAGRTISALAWGALGLLCSFAQEPGQPRAIRAFGGVQPAVSPDGNWIALSYQGAICKIPAAGGRLTRLSSEPGWDVDPAWSPDGSTIAFARGSRFAGGTLRVIRADDAAPVELPALARVRGPLAFSSDGSRILGLFSDSPTLSRLGWFDLGSGELDFLEGIGAKDDTDLQRQRMTYALSNDGEWLLYALHQDRAGEQGGNNGPMADLWRVPAKGGTPEHVVRYPARIYNLCWDENDRGCYLVTDLGTAHNDIWHLPLEDSLRRARKLTFGQADEDWPSLSSRAGILVHTDNAESATALVRLDLKSGDRRVLTTSGVDFRAPCGSLSLRFLDGESGEPVMTRVSLNFKGGKFHAPVGALYRITGEKGHFYCAEAEMVLPAGTYELLAMRGLEYRSAQVVIEVVENAHTNTTVTMERWADMASAGWYSGENHVHANYGYGAWYNTPATILHQCGGEDLNVCNAVVANSDGDGVFDREYFLGRPDDCSLPDTILYWNQEFRSTLWGHLTLSNLSHLVEPIFTGFLQTTNPWDVPTNADIAKMTLDQQAIVSYTHPAANFLDLYDQPYAAKGLPVDAALHRIQTMDVMGNTYQGSLLLWYKLLNCGFRIHASAGTDCFLNRIPSYPPGWGRAYVLLPEGLTYASWVEGQRVGQAFVTNGPMLEFTADGAPLGGVIEMEAPRRVHLRGKVRSQFPLSSVELIYSGEVTSSVPLSPDKLTATLDQELQLDRSGWLALRAEGPPASYVLRANLYAHTNPIYVELMNRPLPAAEEAEYFLRWIDRLESDFRRRGRVPTKSAMRHVVSQFNAARQVYKSIRERSTTPP